MEKSDPELMLGMVEGDRDAFAAFYDRHAPRVLGLIEKWLEHRDGAEDVLQDTFCEVWRRAGKYDPARSTPAVWLLLLARSRTLDRKRRQRGPNGAPAAAEPMAPDDPIAAVENGEAAGRVRDALTRLPDEQRDAILLAFYGGMTHEEVAERQGVPLGTAKTRIRLGMRRLRKLLGE
jgi:RNA polymerase sigma-70 factor (ECF subfamily)